MDFWLSRNTVVHTQELCWQEIINKIAQEGISWPSVFIGKNWQENTLIFKKKKKKPKPVQIRCKSLLWCFPFFFHTWEREKLSTFSWKTGVLAASPAVKIFLWLIQYLMVTTALSKERSAAGLTQYLFYCWPISVLLNIFSWSRSIKEVFSNIISVSSSIVSSSVRSSSCLGLLHRTLVDFWFDNQCQDSFRISGFIYHLL